MGLIMPDFGLFFWMVLSFAILFFVLAKFAWKPIMQGIKERESQISEALNQAGLARKEVADLEARNAQMLQQAQQERDALMRDAQESKQRILQEAKDLARKQAEEFMLATRETMRLEEAEMRKQLRKEVLQLTVLATERILREQLADSKTYERHVDRVLAELQQPSQS